MIPTVIGRLEAVEISTVEIVYSFQALMNTKISVVTIPGAAIGRVEPDLLALDSLLITHSAPLRFGLSLR